MDHVLKRTLSFVLALVMILSLAPVTGVHVHATEAEKVVVAESTEEAAVEEPAEEPAAEEPAEEPAAEEPAEEPAAEEPAEEPVAEEPAEEPVAEEPAEEPVAEEPAEEPVAEESAEEPVVEDPAAEDSTEEPELILDEDVVTDVAVLASPVTENYEGDYSAKSEELADLGISATVTYNSDEAEPTKCEWVVNGAMIQGELVGGALLTGMRRHYYEATTTLTLTNNKTIDAELSFMYNATSLGSAYGSITVDGKEHTATASEQPASITLAPGESTDIILHVAKRSTVGNKNPEPNGASIAISDIKLAGQGSVTVDFAAAENGSYTVTKGETSLTVPGEAAVQTTDRLTMTATPADGYSFAGWYNETTEKYLSADLTYTTLFEENAKVTAKFIPAADGVFGVGEAVFTDLNDAAVAAATSSVKTVVLLKDATLTGSNTIPYGVTLLIPSDEKHTLSTDDPISKTVDHGNSAAANYKPYEKPSAFRTLTMASGASIAVYGDICVHAIHESCIGGQVYGGQVLGKYGEIKMQGDAEITLKNGSNLYAWGYIWGSGTVEALSGANVYEKMQVTDYRGGSNTAAIAMRNGEGKTDGAFPFNQYYIQNVEVKEVLHEGATLMAHAAVNLAGEDPAEAAVEFIGSSTAMFTAMGATITKQYHPAIDRLSLSVDGDENSYCEINGLSLAMGGQLSIDSANFVLPINSNIDININAGAAVVNQELVLQPGVRVNVGANAMLASNSNVYVMDADQWGEFVFSGKRQQPVVYTPSLNGASTRTINSDAIMDINGYVMPIGGVFTTEGGAQIISSGKTGVIEFGEAAPEDENVYQITGGSDVFAISVASAKLTNDNPGKAFTETKGAASGDTFFYCPECNTWHREEDGCYTVTAPEVTWVGADGEPIVTIEFEAGTSPEYQGDTPTKAADGCTVYTFAGWSTEANGGGTKYAVGTDLPISEESVTYFAYFSESESHAFNSKASTQQATAADCDNAATYYVQCDNCDAVHTTKTVAVGSANGHAFNSKASAQQATAADCDNAATYYVQCDNCDAVHTTKTVAVGSANGHVFNSKASAQQATAADCDNAATYYVQCDNCDEVDTTKTVAVGTANGHRGTYYFNWSSSTEENESTCFLKFYCPTCGKDVFNASSDDDGEVKTVATCKTPGIRSYTFDFSKEELPEGMKWENFELNNADFNQEGAAWNAETKVMTWDRNMGLDDTNHESEKFIYVKNENDTHTVKHTCCGAEEEPAPHDYNNADHKCVCDNVEKFTITFASNDDWFTFDPITITKPYGEEITEDDLDPLNALNSLYTGWYVDFWCLMKDDGELDSDNPYTAPKTMGAENVTVYACWTPRIFEFIIKDSRNDNNLVERFIDYGTSWSSAEDLNAVYSIFVGPKENAPEYGEVIDVPVGYRFAGYTFDREGTKSANEYRHDKEEDLTLYAQIVPETYEIHWVYTGETTKQAYGTEIVEPAAPTRKGYTFAGWEFYEKCDDEYHFTGAYDGDTVPAHDLYAKATWEKCNHSGNTNTPTKDSDSFHSFSCSVCRENVVSVHVYDETTHKCVCGDVEKITIFIQYNNPAPNAFGPTDMIEPYGTTVTLPSSPEVTGYTFVGFRDIYTREIVAKVENNCEYTFTKHDVTLEAAYERNDYEITWKLNGGKLVEDGIVLPATVKYDLPIKVLTSNDVTDGKFVEREGHTFSHFVDQNGNRYDVISDGGTNEGKKWELGNMPARDLELTAVWTVNKYKLTVEVEIAEAGVEGFDNEVKLTVPYGANLMDALAEAESKGLIPKSGTEYRIKTEDFNGHVWVGYYCDNDYNDVEGMTMPASDFAVKQLYYFEGWESYGERMAYFSVATNNDYLLGWNYIEEDFDDVEGGAWYYFEVSPDFDWIGYRVEGVKRVPYPAEAINGKTYKADADAMAYAASKGETFIDAEEAWFMFGADGKFKSDYTGFGHMRPYYENGMQVWHPGVVENGASGQYYYYVGDVKYGGNTPASDGDVYVQKVSKNNSNSINFVIGGVYTVKTGVIQKYNGITEVNGKLRYYKDAQLMIGNGLTKVEDNYIYVRSNGELVVNRSYWVPENDMGIPAGSYEFDENGYMIVPEVSEKNGVYTENGKLVYYKDGKIGYNAGLINFSGSWYDADGKIAKTEDAWIYVKSNGTLATGKYYVTTVAEDAPLASGDWGIFDEYGILQTVKHGVVDGKYYENNKVIYNAGVVEIEEGKYIYVRSNGEVVMGKDYWITNVGDSGVIAKKYTFDENGYFTPEMYETFDQKIVDGYYYVDGKIAYAAGVVEYGGGYIYVRSNGQVATGKYWPTNTNGLLDAKMYDWGTDGIYIPA